MGPLNDYVTIELPFLDPQYAYAPTHDASIHVFKQLNQSVRFKWKIIKIELEWSQKCNDNWYKWTYH